MLIPNSTHMEQVDLTSAPRAAKTVLGMLKHLSHGQLSVTLPNKEVLLFGSPQNQSADLKAHLILKNWNVFPNSMKSGDIGFAETYIGGDWETPNLTMLIELFILNRQAVESVIYGSWFGRLFYQLRHWSRRNNKSNSSKNIHAHYDLGNSFYQIWLDESMTYSSALFDADQDLSLAAAQKAKIKRACRMAGLLQGANQRVLEIGCGWGSTAKIIAEDFQSNHTGVTLSSAQLEYAKSNLQSFDKKIDLRLQDYRDIKDAPFDAIVSIEMFEAVGKEYWATYFKNVNRLLKKGALACIQTIVIDDNLFDQYIKGTDFIQQYIFPGGCLPSPTQFKALAEHHGLEVIDEFCFGLDYASTLREWRRVFKLEEKKVLELGFDQTFIKTWEFYLCYCEAGFLRKNLDVIQFTLKKV